MLIVDWLHSTVPQLGLFKDTFTFFPCSLTGLAALDLVARSKVLSQCVYTLLQSYVFHKRATATIHTGISMVLKLWERGRPSSGVHPDSLLAGNRDSESTEAIPRGHLGTFGMHCCRVWLPTE
jgi:hypothetical protein